MQSKHTTGSVIGIQLPRGLRTVFSNIDDGYSSSRNIIGWQGLHRHSLVLPDRHKIHPNYIGYSNAQNGRER